MIRRLAVVVLVSALPLVPTAHSALADEYKKYCVVTETPIGPQPPMVCVVDPTPGNES